MCVCVCVCVRARVCVCVCVRERERERERETFWQKVVKQIWLVGMFKVAKNILEKVSKDWQTCNIREFLRFKQLNSSSRHKPIHTQGNNLCK